MYFMSKNDQLNDEMLKKLDQSMHVIKLTNMLTKNLENLFVNVRNTELFLQNN